MGSNRETDGKAVELGLTSPGSISFCSLGISRFSFPAGDHPPLGEEGDTSTCSLSIVLRWKGPEEEPLGIDDDSLFGSPPVFSVKP